MGPIQLGAQTPEASAGPGRAKNIVRGVGSLSVQSVLSAGLGFVFLASLLRYLPTQAYGVYAALQATIGLGGVLASFGLQYAVVKFLASSKAGNGGWGAAKATLLLTAATSAATSLVIVGLAPYLSAYFTRGQSWSWVFDLGALWLFTSAMGGVLMGVVQGQRRYSLMAGTLIASKVLQAGVAVVGLALYQSLSIAIVSMALYGAILSAVALFVAWKPLPGASPREYFRPVMKYAAPLGLAALFTSVAATADIIVVGGYLDLTSLGVYNASIVIASVISSFFVIPLSTALFAEASFSSETHAEVSRGLALAVRYVTLMVLPASLFASAVSPQLIGLFSGGGTYAEGIPYLQLITGFYIFAAVQAIAVNVLQGVGKTKEVLALGGVTAVADIGLALSLVPIMGLAGAAVSRVAVMVLGSVVSLYFLRGYLKGALRLPFVARVLAASVVPSLVVGFLTAQVSNRTLTLLPYALLGLGLFLACSRLLSLLTPEDKHFLGHLLPARLGWLVHLL